LSETEPCVAVTAEGENATEATGGLVTKAEAVADSIGLSLGSVHSVSTGNSGGFLGERVATEDAGATIDASPVTAVPARKPDLTSERTVKHVHQGQKSSDGRAVRQPAPKSGTLNAPLGLPCWKPPENAHSSNGAGRGLSYRGAKCESPPTSPRVLLVGS
jgi:hypothetical protein